MSSIVHIGGRAAPLAPRPVRDGLAEASQADAAQTTADSLTVRDPELRRTISRLAREGKRALDTLDWEDVNPLIFFVPVLNVIAGIAALQSGRNARATMKQIADLSKGSRDPVVRHVHQIAKVALETKKIIPSHFHQAFRVIADLTP